MKKIQNYLTKPEELKKKLEDSSFRQEFMQWGKSSHRPSKNKSSRSKSPQIGSKTKINPKNTQSRSKENLVPNHANKSNSQLKKNLSLSKSCLNQQKARPKSLQRQRPLHNSSLKSFHNYGQNNRSLDTSNDSKYRSQFESKKIQKQQNSIPKKTISIAKKKRISELNSELRVTLDHKTGYKMKFTYSSRTKQGVLASNPKKTNQDRLLVEKITSELLHSGKDKHLFVVADGHGSVGHLVSEMIVQNYPVIAKKQMEKKNPEQAFPVIYNVLQKILTQSQINVSCSGSTLVSVVLEDQFITCANVGDSRAILARQVDKKNWELIYLSQDQKPSIESEKKRILKTGARVHCLKDQNGEAVGPMRVWLPNQNIQGLAMSRSMGDNISKPYGVTHKPEIIKVAAQKRDKFILIASDGVWEFISNQQVLQLIVPFYRQKKIEQACEALLKLAYQRWTVEDTTVVDDITFVLIFFDN